MADAANDRYFVPEQISDRADISVSQPAALPEAPRLSTGRKASTSRLAQSIDAGYNLDTPSVVKAKYRGAVTSKASSLGSRRRRKIVRSRSPNATAWIR